MAEPRVTKREEHMPRSAQLLIVAMVSCFGLTLAAAGPKPPTPSRIALSVTFDLLPQPGVYGDGSGRYETA
jgi:hypothetical protein